MKFCMSSSLFLVRICSRAVSMMSRTSSTSRRPSGESFLTSTGECFSANRSASSICLLVGSDPSRKAWITWMRRERSKSSGQRSIGRRVMVGGAAPSLNIPLLSSYRQLLTPYNLSFWSTDTCWSLSTVGLVTVPAAGCSDKDFLTVEVDIREEEEVEKKEGRTGGWEGEEKGRKRR